MDTKQSIEEIIKTAVWAPSGDNSQPWRFEVYGGKVLVFQLPEKDNPIFNFRNRGTLVASGALVENIAIAAKSYGFEAQIKILPDPAKPNLVAEINLVAAQAVQADPLFESIIVRATNRRRYEKNKPLSPAQIQLFKNIASDFGVTLNFAQEAEQMRKIGSAVSKNETVMLENKKLHDYFYGDIRWTTKSERKLKTGLYLRTMELEPPQLVVFKLLQFWPVARVLNKLGIARFIAKENAKIYGSASAIGIMDVPDQDSKFVDVGRALQRVWLEATRQGLSVHLLTGVVFLAQLVNVKQTNDFSDEHVAIIRAAYSELAAINPVQSGEVMAMLFRIGYAKPPSGTQSRLEPNISYF